MYLDTWADFCFTALHFVTFHFDDDEKTLKLRHILRRPGQISFASLNKKSSFSFQFHNEMFQIYGVMLHCVSKWGFASCPGHSETPRRSEGSTAAKASLSFLCEKLL